MFSRVKTHVFAHVKKKNRNHLAWQKHYMNWIFSLTSIIGCLDLWVEFNPCHLESLMLIRDKTWTNYKSNCRRCGLIHETNISSLMNLPLTNSNCSTTLLKLSLTRCRGSFAIVIPGRTWWKRRIRSSLWLPCSATQKNNAWGPRLSRSRTPPHLLMCRRHRTQVPRHVWLSTPILILYCRRDNEQCCPTSNISIRKPNMPTGRQHPSASLAHVASASRTTNQSCRLHHLPSMNCTGATPAWLS